MENKGVEVPKKLIRERVSDLLKPDEWEFISSQSELNRLYALKIQEELAEIQASGYKDIMEFADLLEVVYCFAKENGFDRKTIDIAAFEKFDTKGSFGRLALNNLNPNNPSNKLYFQ